MAHHRIEDIQSLTEIQFRSHQARLRKIRAREADLLRLIDDLEGDKAASQNSPMDHQKPIIAFQNEIQLRRWIDQRRASINIELAQVKAMMAIEREQLKAQFSKMQALRKLAKKCARQDALTASRKLHYGV